MSRFIYYAARIIIALDPHDTAASCGGLVSGHLAEIALSALQLLLQVLLALATG